MTLRYSLLTFILLVLVVIGSFVYYESKNPSVRIGIRIALFAPAVHPAMDEIEKGFKESIAQGTQTYAFDIYNANGNKTLLRAQAEEILHQKYDLIFTIGTQCSHTLHTLTSKKGISTPIVFTAVDDPIKIGLAQSLENSGNQVTGTMVQDDFEHQFQELLLVKPATKRILFVYDPGDGANRDILCKTIANILEKKGIELISIPIFQANEIQQKVTPFIQNCDVVFIYTDHTTVSGIDSLIALCKRFGKTLFASDLNSADKGAALAYGVREYDHGYQAGKKALEILDEHKRPSQVAITPVQEQHLKVNTATMGEQGLNLNQQALAEIKARGGIIQ